MIKRLPRRKDSSNRYHDIIWGVEAKDGHTWLNNALVIAGYRRPLIEKICNGTLICVYDFFLCSEL